MAGNEQVYPAVLHDGDERTLANLTALDADDSIGPSAADDCRNYTYWGFHCYSTKNGRVDVEYSMDNTTWRVLEQVMIVATIPADYIYRKTARFYRVTYTDLSSEASVVDLQTVRQNN